MSQPDLKNLNLMFIFCQMNYCSNLFTGLLKTSIREVQLIQNAAAHILTHSRKVEHDTQALKSLQ